MKKILILFLFVIFITGCGEGDKHSNYAILKRNLNVTIETSQSILNLLDIAREDAITTGPLSSSHIWATHNIVPAVVNLKKAITIPFVYESKLSMNHILKTNVYLCGKKETRVETITITKMYFAREEKAPKMKPGAIILTPDLMRKKNLLNDDNTVKGNLCFEAAINIGHIREKDDQHFVVTEDEINRAIIEYENF